MRRRAAGAAVRSSINSPNAESSSRARQAAASPRKRPAPTRTPTLLSTRRIGPAWRERSPGSSRSSASRVDTSIDRRDRQCLFLCRRQMVLSDPLDRARLRTLFALGFVAEKANLVADRQSLELAADERIAMHIHLVPRRRADEGMIGKYARDPPVVRRRVERIAHRDQNVLMGVMFRGIAFDDNLAVRNRQRHAQMIELALPMLPRARFDGDAARHDPRKEFFQLGDALADMTLDRGRRRHMAKGDLQRDLHDRTPEFQRRSSCYGD